MNGSKVWIGICVSLLAILAGMIGVVGGVWDKVSRDDVVKMMETQSLWARERGAVVGDLATLKDQTTRNQIRMEQIRDEVSDLKAGQKLMLDKIELILKKVN
jgi:hypothetical protein